MQLLILVDEAKEAKVDSLPYPFEGLFFWSLRGERPRTGLAACSRS